VVVDNENTRVGKVVMAMTVDGGLLVASSGWRRLFMACRKSQNRGRKPDHGGTAAQA